MEVSRRYVNSFNTVSSKFEHFKNFFISNDINEWNKLDPDIGRYYFIIHLLKFIRPFQRKTFDINDSVGIKL